MKVFRMILIGLLLYIVLLLIEAVATIPLMYVGVLLLISSLDAFGNNNAGRLFGTPTIYLLFACYFLGPLLYARAKRLS